MSSSRLLIGEVGQILACREVGSEEVVDYINWKRILDRSSALEVSERSIAVSILDLGAA